MIILFGATHLKAPKKDTDTIRILSASSIIYNNDTLQLEKTTFHQFLKVFDIKADSLPRRTASDWDGEGINSKTGKLEQVGGRDYQQEVPYRECKVIFFSRISPDIFPDSFRLAGLIYKPKFSCEQELVKSTVLFLGDTVLNTNPEKALKKLMTGKDMMWHDKNRKYYLISKYHCEFELVKCGKHYKLEQLIFN